MDEQLQPPQSLLQQLDEFYSRPPPKDDPNKQAQEIQLMAEALQSPETARAVFEHKLSQLAAVRRFEDVAQLESLSEISRALPADTASRARAGFPDGTQVFYHEVPVQGLMVDRGTYQTYNTTSRLFWARDGNGKLLAVRTNFPHLDHYTVEITDENVEAGLVQRPLMPTEADPEMELGSRDPLEVAGIFTQKFN